MFNIKDTLDKQYIGKAGCEMNDLNLVKIAEETIEIIKQGHYKKGKKQVDLITASYTKFSDVIVLDTDRLYAIKEDDDDFFENSFYGTQGASIYIVEADSLEAAEGLNHPLVMNFANAHRPGGGFLHGARAQEESICRNSTLYASISSRKAKEMYEHNNRYRNPMDSDYMLISPDVCVFRNRDGELLDEPYKVSVCTIAAPNKNGDACYTLQDKIDSVMKERLRLFFMAAARHGYKTLVLGAWGCGAFGHDTRCVAQYYYDLLIDEKYTQFFDDIVFAIYRDKKKLEIFKDVFGEKAELCMDENQNQERSFSEVSEPFPVCNHALDVSNMNLGYTAGIITGGIPFEAELWKNDNSKVVSIYILEKTSKMNVSEISNQKKDDNEHIIGFHSAVKYKDNAVLRVGMEALEELDNDSIHKYVDYMIEVGLVSFTSNLLNGSGQRLIDIEGKNIVCIAIALESEGQLLADTPLHFCEFPGYEKKHMRNGIKVIK